MDKHSLSRSEKSKANYREGRFKCGKGRLGAFLAFFYLKRQEDDSSNKDQNTSKTKDLKQEKPNKDNCAYCGKLGHSDNKCFKKKNEELKRKCNDYPPSKHSPFGFRGGTSETRELALKFKEINKVLCGFNHAVSIPIARSKIKIIIDNKYKIAQIQDHDIEVIHKILESDDRQPDVKQYFEKYDLKGGVIFRRTEDGNKWVVPRMSRWNIVKMCHDDQGHFALQKTLDKIRENYWFKGMRRFVTKYVRACLNCLYYKSKSGRKPGFLHPIDKVVVPFHTLHLDDIGPFIHTKNKNTQILIIIDWQSVIRSF